MQRVCGRAGSHSPGLTPLTGQYARGGPLWACFGRGDPFVSFVTDHDATNDSYYCYRYKDLYDVAKLAYYAAKALETIKKFPIPPPP